LVRDLRSLPFRDLQVLRRHASLWSGVPCEFPSRGHQRGRLVKLGENKGAGALQQQWRILERERAGAWRGEGDNKRKEKVIYSELMNRRAVGW
jgi:hypothetical protein